MPIVQGRKIGGGADGKGLGSSAREPQEGMEKGTWGGLEEEVAAEVRTRDLSGGTAPRAAQRCPPMPKAPRALGVSGCTSQPGIRLLGMAEPQQSKPLGGGGGMRGTAASSGQHHGQADGRVDSRGPLPPPTAHSPKGGG